MTVVPDSARAELDSMQFQLQRQFEEVLRWDNVEGKPEWVAGQLPRYHFKLGLHLVKLEPGKSITVRVPRGSYLRLYHPSHQLVNDDVTMLHSNGSGLYANLPIVTSTDQNSLIVQTDLGNPSLIQIIRPERHQEALSFALFFSRIEPVGEIAPYRDVIPLSLPSVQLRRGDQAASQTYWQLQPEKTTSVTVKGPARYALEQRFVYPETESQLFQTYRIHISLNGQQHQTMAFETATENAASVYVNWLKQVVGRLETGYIDIPEGEHLLQLDTTAKLYGRLLLQAQPDYLLPRFNQPAITSTDGAEKTTKLSRNSYWHLDQNQIKQSIAEFSVLPSELEYIAQRLARDNSHREGGMSAAMLMRESAGEYAHDKDIQAVANGVRSFHTFYRDLLPVHKTHEIPQSFNWFIAKRLHHFGEQGKQPVGNDQHARDLISQLGNAYFINLPYYDPEKISVKTEVSDNTSKIILPGNVLFDTDKSIIKTDYQDTLAGIAKSIQQDADGDIYVVGHTDSRASEEYNQKLSKQRAQTVADILIAHGVEKARLKISGKGEVEPAASNTDTAGRQLNRRVEITFVPKAKQREASVSSCHLIHCYYLPSRSTPGFLRIIADLESSTQGATLMVQFDDAQPVQMVINAQSLLAEDEFAMSSAETGLQLLQQKNEEITYAPTLEGVFARRHVPASMVRAGVLELFIPTTVRQVKVWQSGIHSDQVRVALQYRAAKPFSLSETEYLEMVRRITDKQSVYDLFLNAQMHTDFEAIQEKELANNWLPLLRFLKSQYQLYTVGVTALKQPVSTNILTDSVINQLRVRANKAQLQHQWLVALEIWTQILQGSHGLQETQREAKLSRINALQYLGEHFLLEQQLRGLLFYSEDEVLRETAYKKLVDYYRKTDDVETLQMLLAALVHINATPEYLHALTQVLFENGHYERALMVGLVVPSAVQPIDTVIRAVYQLGWWQVFEDLLGQLPNEQERQFWYAQRSIEWGDYKTALEQFNAAGETGKKWFEVLSEGLAIKEDLKSREVNAVQLTKRWQHWKVQHPGPFNWHEAKNYITDYAGGVSLYNLERDTYFHSFRSSPEKPVQLRFTGPLTLKIEARPIHPAEITEAAVPIDGWLHLRGQNGLRIAPITDNYPTDSFSIIGEDTSIVGKKVSSIFSFGPGQHEIEVTGNELPLLIRVFEQRPELDMGILPPLDSNVLAYKDTALPSSLGADISPENKANIDALAWPEATYLAKGEIDAAISLYSDIADQNKDSILRNMTLLLWLAEQQPERHIEMLAFGESLTASNPGIPQLRMLQRRLARNAAWLPLTNIQRSAGLRYLEVKDWQPETPAMRIRKTMLSPIQEGEQVISGANRLVMSMNNLQPAKFEVVLSQEDIQYMTSLPMTIRYQIDEQSPIHVVLTPEEPTQTIQVSVPTGKHILHIGIENPVVNQFLRVVIKENGATTLVRTTERPYNVATHQEPIMVGLAGPAWLRFDQLSDGVTFSQYQLIEDGWQTLKILPEEQRKESLVRILQRMPGLREREIPSRQFKLQPGLLAEPLISLQLSKQPDQLTLHDGFPLGQQEDGTWSINVAGVSRRNFGDNLGDNQSERFFESSLTHRYYHENSRVYFKTDLLGRSREQGEPTFGIKETLIYRPLWAPVNFRLDGSLYTQQFQQASRKNYEWTGFVQASVAQRREINPKTWHMPELSYFYRALSLDSDTGDNQRLDQDIFTQYKADHQRGLRVSDTFMHRPWLDTIWHSNVSVVSNENGNIFNPDHIRASAGWRQLAGNVELGASYQFLQFFSDNQRNRNFNRHTVMASLSLDRWRINQQRVEVGLRYRRDFDISSHNGLLYLSWHFGRGRMYRDFHFREVNFLNLRKLHIPNQTNNHIGAGDGT